MMRQAFASLRLFAAMILSFSAAYNPVEKENINPDAQVINHTDTQWLTAEPSLIVSESHPPLHPAPPSGRPASTASTELFGAVGRWRNVQDRERVLAAASGVSCTDDCFRCHSARPRVWRLSFPGPPCHYSVQVWAIDEPVARQTAPPTMALHTRRQVLNHCQQQSTACWGCRYPQVE